VRFIFRAEVSHTDTGWTAEAGLPSLVKSNGLAKHDGGLITGDLPYTYSAGPYAACPGYASPFTEHEKRTPKRTRPQPSDISEDHSLTY